MKTNLSLILNAVLFVVTGYLLSAHLKEKGGQAPTTSKVKTEQGSSGVPNIVYVNSDSLLKNFNDYQAKVKELDKKGQDAEAALVSRSKSLERDFLQTQQKVQQGLLTPNQVQQEEQRLMLKQQSLAAEQEKVGKQLMEERQKILEVLEKQIKDILTELRGEKGYDFILSYGPGTGVLMVNDALDVTGAVLEKLNEQKDTTAGAPKNK
ncbi:MAG: OmpH family outer membrane protein [Saprospiraceae bacterium]|jgi:outer membrane protein